MTPDEMRDLAQSAALKWADLFVDVDALATEWHSNFGHVAPDDFGTALSMLAYDGARRAKVPTVLELRQVLEQVRLAQRAPAPPTAVCDGTGWVDDHDEGLRPCPACNPVAAGHPWTGPLPKRCLVDQGIMDPGSARWAQVLADSIEERRRQGLLVGDAAARERRAAYRAGIIRNRHGLEPGDPRPISAGLDALVATLRQRGANVELPVVPERRDVDG